MVSVASITAEIRRPPWLQKAARTGFAVLPGLLWWASFGDARGIILAFAALCISVTYGAGVRPWHMLGVGLVGALLLPGATWIEAHPLACVPAIMVVMVGYVLIRRRTPLPERLSTWLLIFLLYQSSELNAEGVAPSLVPALLVVPATLWSVFVCYWLWPGRGEARPDVAKPKAAKPSMSVPRHAATLALAAGLAAAAGFRFDQTHVNWAIWSAITVVQAAAHDSFVKCGRRVLGGALGCAIGYALLVGLAPERWLLDIVTGLLVLLMVSLETYVLAVGVRSALAVLAALQLGGNGAWAGLVRIESIAIGVAIALVIVLAMAPRGSWTWGEVWAEWRPRRWRAGRRQVFGKETGI